MTRPYSLKQYKMIKPREYVEISNIKPGKHILRTLFTTALFDFQVQAMNVILFGLAYVAYVACTVLCC